MRTEFPELRSRDLLKGFQIGRARGCNVRLGVKVGSIVIGRNLLVPVWHIFI